MPTQRSARWQRRSLYIVVALVVLVLALWGLWPRAEPVELGEVTRGDIEVTVREEGKTRVIERYRVVAPVAGQLERVELEPGDPVAAGAPLATIHPAHAVLLDPATRASAQAQWEAARDERVAAAAALDSAEAERVRAEAELRRNAELAERGLIAAQDLQRLESAARAAQASVNAAEARLRAAVQRAAAARAALDLQGAEAGVGTAAVTVTAPADGVVLQRPRESAGPVAAGELLMELGDVGRIEAEIEVLSADAVNIDAGAPARLHRWGGEVPLAGRVQRVEPGGYTKISALGVEEQRVRVIVDFVGDPAARPALGDGYRVEGEFVTWSSDDALRVPVSALFRDGDVWAAYRLVDGRAQRVQVDVGHLGETHAEVRGGLDAGDRVVLYPGDDITDGARIRARETAPED